MCSFYHESLRTWIKTIIDKFAISDHTVSILGVHAIRSYLKLTVNMSFIAYQIKVNGAKDHGKTASRSDLFYFKSYGFDIRLACSQKLFEANL